MAKKDPEKVWVDLCQPGLLQVEAMTFCKKFLRVYATRRKRKQVCLGPEEYSIVSMVRSAATLQTIWQDLVLEFNRTVLARKREEDPHNKSQWCLKTQEGLFVDIKYGPVFEVNKVCLQHPFGYGRLVSEYNSDLIPFGAVDQSQCRGPRTPA